MIRISLGNVGSGKTANEVREMYLNKQKRKTYTNIVAKMDNVVPLNHEMIAKRNVVGEKKKRSGEIEEITELKLNIEFWKGIKEPINVVLDEAHAIINSRRAMSKLNVIVTDWLALIRRVLGQTEGGYGELVFITQLPNRIDVIAREMATQIRYHICHYRMKCKKCEMSWSEHSELPEGAYKCFNCGHQKLKKYNHQIEIWHFKSMDDFNEWRYFYKKTYYKHYLVNDIEKYFPLYDTLQWDNMFSELY